MKTDIANKEIKTLLKAFRKLKRLTDSAPPKKRDRLWEKAREQAGRDLKEKLKFQEGCLIYRSSGIDGASKKTTKVTENQINYMIEQMAEKMYCPLDRKYSSKVEQREAQVIKQIAVLESNLVGIFSTNVFSEQD